MRRFVIAAVILLFSIPFGVSINGCKKGAAVVYCTTGDSGFAVGQLATITLQPQTYGVSINQAEISQVGAPVGTDCKNNPANAGAYTYGTTDMTIADIQPSTGRICGGNWNRNTGGGISDFTVCNPTGKTGVAFITASAGGVVSNAIPVYVHPLVTSVVLGAPSSDCTHDPASNCSPAAINTALATSAVFGCPTSTQYPSNPQLANGCCTVAPGVVDASQISPVAPYNATGCLSQRSTGQLSARVYAGGGTANNISCQVGHLSYSAQSSNIVSIDQNGVATAQQPGSTIINAALSQSGSSAGFFSTCPPVDIALSFPQQPAGTNSITVTPGNTQPITATATDKNGVVLTGLTLEYVSTTPTTIPASATGTVTPIFPGQADITAICAPPTCNTAPYSEIGLYGNGKTVTSKAVTINTPGVNTTDLYIASTNSRYLVPVNFTQTTLGAPVQLPYAPNSMVLSSDGSTLYLGSSTELMIVSAVTNQLSKTDVTVSGTVLAVSPDDGTVVISDPIRQQTYLYSSSGTIESVYGGVASRASWSPDSQTVYLSAGNEVLVNSKFTGWQQIQPATPANTPVLDVTVTQPAVGAYFAGPTTTGRGYCSVSTFSGAAPQTATNQFYPIADSEPVVTDRVSTTSDGLHIIGAAQSTDSLTDLRVTLAPTSTTTNPNTGTQSQSGGITCPADGSALTFVSQPVTVPLTGVAPAVTIDTPPISGLATPASGITGLLTTTNASYDFVTYTGTGSVVPAYLPVASQTGVVTPGTLTEIPLSGTATAPVAGVISSDPLRGHLRRQPGSHHRHHRCESADRRTDDRAESADEHPRGNRIRSSKPACTEASSLGLGRCWNQARPGD